MSGSPLTSPPPRPGTTSVSSTFMVRLKSFWLTVKEKSVVPLTAWFCTIMSTSMLAAATGPRMREAMPGTSGTLVRVILASSRWKAIPEMTACSMLVPSISSSKVISVPDFISSSSGMSGDVRLESTRVLTLYLPANSTERVCRTLLPRLAISSISSKVMRSSRRASETMRGSVV